MAHKHSVYDTDPHFMIDPITRAITTESKKIKLMQRDHNSERYTFEIPRFVDGHDMSLCNKLKIHFNNISSDRANQNKSFYEVKDMQLYPEDENIVIFSWLVGRDATMYGGVLNFSVCFSCIADDGVTIDYEWHTDIYAGISVSDGIHNDEAVIEHYSDLIESWRRELFGTGDTVEASIRETGEEVLASIPEDYTELSRISNEALRTRANAIISTVQGESLVISDASDDYLRGLKVFGKSTQDGTPTPDAPVEIVSIENPVVDIYGANLANLQNLTLLSNTTLEVSDDCYKIKATGGSTKGYASSTTYLNASALAGKSVIFKADSIESDNADAKPVVQLNIFTSTSKAYEAISADNLKRTLKIPEGCTEITLGVYTNNNSTALASDNTIVAKGVGVYLVDTEWERCKDKQSVMLEKTLRGIQVASGGNYIDASGQQWICDEIDLARGVYVQRVWNGRLTSSGQVWKNSKSTAGRYLFDVEAMDGIVPLCSHMTCGVYIVTTLNHMFNNDGLEMCFNTSFSTIEEWKDYLDTNDVELQYALVEPIETPLSDEEIKAFQYMHSNYPHTTVLNNTDAWMEVQYNVDTAIFMHNQLSLLPEVTEDDDGCILRVVNGTWQLVKVVNAEDGEY